MGNLSEGWLVEFGCFYKVLWSSLRSSSLVPMSPFGVFPNDSLNRLCILLHCFTNTRLSPWEYRGSLYDFWIMFQNFTVSVSIDSDFYMCPSFYIPCVGQLIKPLESRDLQEICRKLGRGSGTQATQVFQSNSSYPQSE